MARRISVSQRRAIQDSILVPLDGTSVGETALAYAQAIGQRVGREVRILGNARELALSAIGRRFTKRDFGEAGALRYLESVADGLGAKVPLYGEIVAGDVDEAISIRLKQRDIAFVVVPDKQGPIPLRWFRSSAPERLARAADLPVLFVPMGTPGQPLSPLKRLLVLYDGSPEAHQELRAIGALGQFLRAEMVLFRLVEIPRTRGPANLRMMLAFYDAETRAAIRELQEAAAQLRLNGCQVQVRSTVGDPTENIPFATASEGADAIVTLTRPRTPLLSFFIGDGMFGAMRRARVPIIFLPRTWQWFTSGPMRPRPVFSAF